MTSRESKGSFVAKALMAIVLAGAVALPAYADERQDHEHHDRHVRHEPHRHYHEEPATVYAPPPVYVLPPSPPASINLIIPFYFK